VTDVAFCFASLFTHEHSGLGKRLHWEPFHRQRLMKNVQKRRLLLGPGGPQCDPSLPENGSWPNWNSSGFASFLVA
jgi:hypothetical protein